MELILTILQSAGFATLGANLLTMIIPDKKVTAYGPLVTTIVRLLNTLAMNVFQNKNKS